MISVAFLNPNIPPRVISLLNKINMNKDIKIKGFFFSVSQKNRSWSLQSKESEQLNFDYQILASKSLNFGIKDFHNSFISFDLYSKLSEFSPDIIVIPGWSDISSFIALFWAKINKKKIILRTESTKFEKSIRRTIFLPVTKFICNNVDLILACSNRAKKYAQNISNNKNIKVIYSSFDTKSFSEKIKEQNRKSLKKQFGIKQKKIFYFNGQLIERKGIKELLEAFSLQKDYALIITGNGILQNIVSRYAKKYDNIYYFGYQKQNLLPIFYAVSDYFILPSHEETWGLVTIEAMAAGIPVIISKFAGSSELIQGNNGFKLKKINSEEIANVIVRSANIEMKKYKIISRTNLLLAKTKLSYENISNQFSELFRNLA